MRALFNCLYLTTKCNVARLKRFFLCRHFGLDSLNNTNSNIPLRANGVRAASSASEQHEGDTVPWLASGWREEEEEVVMKVEMVAVVGVGVVVGASEWEDKYMTNSQGGGYKMRVTKQKKYGMPCFGRRVRRRLAGWWFFFFFLRAAWRRLLGVIKGLNEKRALLCWQANTSARVRGDRQVKKKEKSQSWGWTGEGEESVWWHERLHSSARKAGGQISQGSRHNNNNKKNTCSFFYRRFFSLLLSTKGQSHVCFF